MSGFYYMCSEWHGSTTIGNQSAQAESLGRHASKAFYVSLVL
jgi:hypothetical protein